MVRTSNYETEFYFKYSWVDSYKHTFAKFSKGKAKKVENKEGFTKNLVLLVNFLERKYPGLGPYTTIFSDKEFRIMVMFKKIILDKVINTVEIYGVPYDVESNKCYYSIRESEGEGKKESFSEEEGYLIIGFKKNKDDRVENIANSIVQCEPID